MTDRALWITWYDLPAEGRDAYLKWAHETYIPAPIDRIVPYLVHAPGSANLAQRIWPK